MRIKQFVLSGDNVWWRITSVSIVFFTVALADALLSFWVPSFMQVQLGSAFLMGLVMSFSSVIGLLADLVLPQLIQGSTVKKLILLSAMISILFAFTLFVSTLMPYVLLLLVAMALWGVYYEFLGFSRQQFIADATPHKLHASALALTMIFFSLAYTIGPLIAEILERGGDKFVLFFSMILSSLAFLLSQLLLPKTKTHLTVEVRKVNVLAELKYWKTLYKVVWPILILSVMMGVMDSAFWTTGTVLSETLSQKSVLGNFFIPAYMFPSLFMGLVIIKMKIFKHKKKLSEVFFLLSGAMLILIGFSSSVPLIILSVFVSSIFFAVAHPLLGAVYADINERLGRAEEHLIGLSSSAWSLAYVIGPVIAGLIAENYGEQKTFAIVGLFAVSISLFLLLVTKKKLTLPQSEIQNWKS